MVLTDWIHRIEHQSLATAFSELGLSKGSSVCILSQNSANAIIAFWAALWAGFVPNFMNTRWISNELSLSLRDCGASLLLLDEQHADIGKQLLHD